MGFWELAGRGNDDECWPWRGATSRGYGIVNLANTTTTTAHRYAYAREKRLAMDDLKGKVVVQTCRNKLCCNPAHLKLRSKHRAKGSQNPNTKLTEDMIRKMKSRKKAGWTQARLAAHYRLSTSTVSRILSGKLWGHVT